jgi:hypothetical protein
MIPRPNGTPVLTAVVNATAVFAITPYVDKRFFALGQFILAFAAA